MEVAWVYKSTSAPPYAPTLLLHPPPNFFMMPNDTSSSNSARRAANDNRNTTSPQQSELRHSSSSAAAAATYWTEAGPPSHPRVPNAPRADAHIHALVQNLSAAMDSHAARAAAPLLARVAALEAGQRILFALDADAPSEAACTWVDAVHACVAREVAERVGALGRDAHMRLEESDGGRAGPGSAVVRAGRSDGATEGSGDGVADGAFSLAQRQIPLSDVRNFEPRENAGRNQGNEGSSAGKEGQRLTHRRSKKRLRLSNSSSEGDSSNASNRATDNGNGLAAQVAALTERLEKTEAELREVKASAVARPNLQGVFDLQGLVPPLDPTVTAMLSAVMMEEISRRTDILNLRAELRKEIGVLGGRLKTDMGDQRAELKKEAEDLGGELNKEIGDLRGELKKEIGDLRAELKTEIKDLGDELKNEIAARAEKLTRHIHDVHMRTIQAQTTIAKVSIGVSSVRVALLSLNLDLVLFAVHQRPTGRRPVHGGPAPVRDVAEGVAGRPSTSHCSFDGERVSKRS